MGAGSTSSGRLAARRNGVSWGLATRNTPPGPWSAHNPRSGGCCGGKMHHPSAQKWGCGAPARTNSPLRCDHPIARPPAAVGSPQRSWLPPRRPARAVAGAPPLSVSDGGMVGLHSACGVYGPETRRTYHPYPTPGNAVLHGANHRLRAHRGGAECSPVPRSTFRGNVQQAPPTTKGSNLRPGATWSPGCSIGEETT